ncbi:MAG: sigma-70 family RNA polymerase sigma factor [Acidobacteriota bacterium]
MVENRFPPEADDRYSTLREKLAKAIATICPSWLADRREDLVQVSLLRVMELDGRGEGKRELGTSYLWKVAYSVMIDEIRRIRRKREVPMDDAIDSRPEAMDRSDPEREAAGVEIGEGIRDCLQRLLQPRRLALALHIQGHTVPEIAQILRWDSKRVENLTCRGLADLRKCLASKGLKP